MNSPFPSCPGSCSGRPGRTRPSRRFPALPLSRVQRIAFTTSRRKSSSAQLRWKWPPVKPNARPSSFALEGPRHRLDLALAALRVAGRARVVGRNRLENRRHALHVVDPTHAVIPLVANRERLHAARDRVLRQAANLGVPVRVDRIAGLVIAAEPALDRPGDVAVAGLDRVFDRVVDVDPARARGRVASG